MLSDTLSHMSAGNAAGHEHLHRKKKMGTSNCQCHPRWWMDVGRCSYGFSTGLFSSWRWGVCGLSHKLFCMTQTFLPFERVHTVGNHIALCASIARSYLEHNRVLHASHVHLVCFIFGTRRKASDHWHHTYTSQQTTDSSGGGQHIWHSLFNHSHTDWQHSAQHHGGWDVLTCT